MSAKPDPGPLPEHAEIAEGNAPVGWLLRAFILLVTLSCLLYFVLHLKRPAGPAAAPPGAAAPPSP